MAKLRLILVDRGDDSVGMFSQTFTVDVPFMTEQKPTPEELEVLRDFKNEQERIYRDYCNGRLTAFYMSADDLTSAIYEL